MKLSDYEIGSGYYINDNQASNFNGDLYSYAAKSICNNIAMVISDRLAQEIKKDRDGEDIRLTVRGYFFTEPELKRFISSIERELLRQIHVPFKDLEGGDV